ncbi:hypothetical protein [Haladaptatus sp. T7]|uniref:hypothetical protein n=1 Tax=Haladaptatus sp. T7 TaxID=2029368 RepID=UPI0021A25461|nr:hypothetical protein [Haladaptatus sp. T7]GKZ13749.1 hypothetical protein HAL_16300 [Haladaptatus sp. T7]
MSEDTRDKSEERSIVNTTSRRRVLKTAGAGLASLTAATTAASASSPNVTPEAGTSFYLSPSSYDTKKKAGQITRAEVQVDTIENKIWAVANSSVDGEGYVLARLYGTYTPPEDRGYKVTLDYYRRCSHKDSTSTISAFVRSNDYGLEDQSMETLSTLYDSGHTETKDFSLVGGTRYDIGIQLKARASSLGSAASVSDYWNTGNNGRKHLKLNSIKLTPK